MFRVVCVIILLLFFFLFSSKAQDIAFKGVVLDNSDGKRVAGAKVLNLRTQRSIVSNSMGIFTIDGQAGDSIRVSKNDYSEGITIIKSAADIIVQLRPAIQLKEVNVYGETKQKQLQDVMQDFRKKGVYYNGKPPASLLLPFGGSPITFFYELFGKTPKNARRFQHYMNVELEQSLIDKKFSPTLVQSVTGLSGEDLDNFMGLYRPSFKNAEKWNDYDARSYIKSSFERFEADGRPSAPKLPKLEIPPQEK